MIYCQMDGRLGNQLFRYAFARKVSLLTGQPVVFNWSEIEKKGWKNDLLGFSCALDLSPKAYRLPRRLKWRLDYYRIKRKIRLMLTKPENRRLVDDKISLLYAEKLKKHGIFLVEEGYTDFDCFDFKDIVLYGMFESRRYFDEIHDHLRAELVPHTPDPKNDALVAEIASSESVCVTIRRGDFLDPAIAKTHLVCDIAYYTRAVKEIASRVKNPRFFVFSDDIAWVKENIAFPEGSVFESGNDPVEEKMRVMRACKHFVLSNSTFSWWCCYLSAGGEGQVVVSPRTWSPVLHITDLIDENWILI